MTAAAWRLVGFVGLALIAVGLYVGLAPVKVATVTGAQDCGSAFHGRSTIVAACDSKRADRRTWAVALLIAGAILGVAALSQIPTRDEPVSAS